MTEISKKKKSKSEDEEKLEKQNNSTRKTYCIIIYLFTRLPFHSNNFFENSI